MTPDEADRQTGHQLLPRRSPTYTSPLFLWIIICCGALLRLAQYLFNRSLWFDEALLAHNIINRSFSGLLKPLDYAVGAPLGFLMLEKLAVQMFGSSEYALRLVPLLAGILSLYLFYRVAKLCVTPKAVPIALGLFALSGYLIYYASETKQYSTDVAIGLELSSAALYFGSCELSAWHVAVFGFLGAAAIWFSHPSVFVLGGIGTSLTLSCLVGKRWARIRSFSIAYSLWAFSLALCYFFHFRHLSKNTFLLHEWSHAFVPFPPLSLPSIQWFVDTFFGIFQKPVGLELSGIAALTFLVGCISMFSNKRENFLILISPTLFTLLAAGLHKYPFFGKLILFIVPAFLLLIAEGAEQIRQATIPNAPIIGLCLIGLLFFHPLSLATYHLIKPPAWEDMKPVMNYVQEHERDGDVLYIYYGARPAFRYYAPRYRLQNMKQILGAFGRDNYEKYTEDTDKLRGHRRVWLLFSHVPTSGVDEDKFFLYLLDSRGTSLDSFKRAGAAVYLYDLAEPRSSNVRHLQEDSWVRSHPNDTWPWLVDRP